MSARRIDPEYSFRFTTADIRATYGTAEQAFARGDFLNAAQMAPPDSELKGCALILGGLIEQGLAILNARAELGGRTVLCKALALWSLGWPESAISALRGVTDPDFAETARTFATLIGRDNITVFITGAILSVFAEHYSESFIAPSYKYGRITAKYVGSQLEHNAYGYDPATPFDTFINRLPAAEKPDLLFALSPQWLMAKDFHKVSTPKVIWCHDSDAFQYRNVDNYALYDAAICNCSQEHFELSQGTPGLYCAANMLLHPLATPFPEALPYSEKTLDVIFTGSAIAPFHSEKPRFLFKIADIAQRHNLRIVEGHLPEKDYFALISHAKFMPIVNRYAGSPSPRWRDALASGTCVLYPEGTFYGEIAPGCFTYRAATINQDIEAHLEKFDQGADPAYDLSQVVPEINRRFAIHRQPREVSFERLLKYALFMGLIWPRTTPEAKRPRQRRLCWLTPAVDCGLFGPAHVRDQVSHIAAHIDDGDLTDAVDFNNAAHVHAQLVFMFHESSEVENWIAKADHYFKAGLARFPNSLLLTFNDAHWSFFKPNADIHVAAEKFLACVNRFDALEFDVCGSDVAYAYTLHEADEVFPCYEYADVATSDMVLRHTPQLLGVKNLPHDPQRLILSACHGYLGWANLKEGDRSIGLAHLRRAMDIYPLGLPVARLYFDTLLRHALYAKTVSKKDAADLADAFISVVNINPSSLLTHALVVAALLAEAGEQDNVSEILSAWYRLANVVHSLRVEDETRILKRLSILYHLRALLPAELRWKIDAGLKNSSDTAGLTQLETRIVKAWHRTAGGRRWWPSAKALGRWKLQRILSESMLNQQRIVPSNIKRGLLLWWQVPRDVKLVYFNKAWRMAARGQFKAVMLRVQQWGIASKWSLDPALNARRRRRRFDRLRRLWQQLRGV